MYIRFQNISNGIHKISENANVPILYIRQINNSLRSATEIASQTFGKYISEIFLDLDYTYEGHCLSTSFVNVKCKLLFYF